MRRVVITGIGSIAPNGRSAQENWESVLAGCSGIGKITQFDVSDYASQIAGEVKSYDPLKHFSTKDLRKMDRFIQFCVIAGEEAIKSSGLDLSSEALDRIGASIGVGLGGLAEIQNQYSILCEKGPRRVSPFFIPMVIGNLAAGSLSLKYGLKGSNTCLTTACSSSGHAIGESFQEIQLDRADVMLAGGAESVICELAVAGFCSARALSERNAEPEKASRPFDKDRDGFVMGEGSAVLVLEEYERARKRGAPIFAELVGYAANADAYHITAPHPEGEGAARCMDLALKDARLNPTDIDYINAHGTATPLGDIVETLAIKRTFGPWSKEVWISSTKSMTGHLLGAAGAIEAVFCVQAIRDGVVPPTINLENPDPQCDLNYVPNEARKKKIRAAMSNSFGFGGTNSCLVFKRLD